ncbi:MAG: hypothetical protein WD063_12525 [Pirellulales bacterium]
MFRPWLVAGSAVALAVSVAASAQAQFPRGMRFPASLQDVFMLRNEAVRKELNVNDEQQAVLASLAAKLQQDAFEIISGLQDLTPEEQKEAMADVMKMVAEKGKEVKQQVDGILDKTQIERFKELSLQSRGAQALEDDEMVAALEITDEQKKQLAGIREDGMQAVQEAFQKLRGGGSDQGDIRKKIMEMRNRLSDKALTVLTPEQREQFEKMKGAKFDFPAGRGFPF